MSAITAQYNPRKSLHRRGTKVLRKKPVASMDARKVSSQFTLRKKIDERFRVFYVKMWLYEAKAT